MAFLSRLQPQLQGMPQQCAIFLFDPSNSWNRWLHTVGVPEGSDVELGFWAGRRCFILGNIGVSHFSDEGGSKEGIKADRKPCRLKISCDPHSTLGNLSELCHT